MLKRKCCNYDIILGHCISDPARPSSVTGGCPQHLTHDDELLQQAPGWITVHVNEVRVWYVGQSVHNREQHCLQTNKPTSLFIRSN